MAELNLDFYSGVDAYSDGPVEDTILEIVKNSESTISRQNNWAVTYHLSPIRRNLLEWYGFDKESSLLEIGGGCGALTGMFAEKVKEVKVVELSYKRAGIIHHRYHNYANIEILVGSLNDVKLKQQFDYITLIGVLEYAGIFVQAQQPFKTLLANAKKHLKSQGKLVLAIENKFGLKYWAGAREDHTGRHFDSIEGYPNDKKVQTFGKYELTELLNSVGFFNVLYYYPMPDYKLPTIIYSDDYLPDETASFDSVSPNLDQPRYKLFNENLVYRNIIKNKMFDFFANSFLVFAS